MPPKRELFIPLEALTRIAYSCKDCNAVVIVDITDKNQRANITVHQKTCPVCNYKQPERLFLAFRDFLNWYQEAIDANQKVHFIVSE